jgi:hypothetical protein
MSLSRITELCDSGLILRACSPLIQE